MFLKSGFPGIEHYIAQFTSNYNNSHPLSLNLLFYLVEISEFKGGIF
jgi:hypothetical protein